MDADTYSIDKPSRLDKDGFIIEHGPATPVQITEAALAGYSVTCTGDQNKHSYLARYPWRVEFGGRDLRMCYHTASEAWTAAWCRLQERLAENEEPG